MVHNFRFTDKKILEFIQKENLKKIQVSQGYSNCSISVIAENAVIVQDQKMAEILRKHRIDVLCLAYVPDIKLLKNQNEYSKMKGFIGGAMAKIENKIVIFGDLKKIDKQDKIKDFIQKYHLEILDFEGLDVVDYGGVLIV